MQRGDKFFIRVKGKDKLLGPVEQFDQFVVSTDGNHYAIARGRDGLVEVDGKPLVKGFSVSYNAQLNAFHWWNTEGKKVYVYTEKLNHSLFLYRTTPMSPTFRNWNIAELSNF